MVNVPVRYPQVQVHVLLLFFHVLRSYGDPCTNYTVLSGEIRRSSAYILTQSDTAICDNFLTEQWYMYRIDSLAGNEIVRTCPAITQCGTMYPLWMNGTLPAVSEGEADRTVCRSGIGGCCEDKLTVQVRNCGTYYVYNLKPPTGCPMSYCFGTGYGNETLTTASTTISTEPATPSLSTASTITSTESATPASISTASTITSIFTSSKSPLSNRSKGDQIHLVIIVACLCIVLCIFCFLAPVLVRLLRGLTRGLYPKHGSRVDGFDIKIEVPTDPPQISASQESLHSLPMEPLPDPKEPLPLLTPRRGRIIKK